MRPAIIETSFASRRGMQLTAKDFYAGLLVNFPDDDHAALLCFVAKTSRFPLYW